MKKLSKSSQEKLNYVLGVTVSLLVIAGGLVMFFWAKMMTM